MLHKAAPTLQSQGRITLFTTGQLKTHLSQSFHRSWDANDDSYDYTRGRFLSNEPHEMKIRRVKLNLNELAKSAAESIGFTYSQCVRIEKFPDGMFNKAFLFTMQDGTQVVGKVPNPNAGRPHYTTASEVATMDFVRNELSTPVPRVLAWSSEANENPVGAEYIIMEKAEGVQLDKVWPKMDIKKRFELVKTIAEYQKAWMSRSFTQYGSLYYSSGLPNIEGCVLVKEDGSNCKEHRFAVGPTTGREFLDDGRIDVDFDRGPWGSVHQYKSAVGFRELACVQNMARLPRSFLGLYGPGTYTPSRFKKIAALQHYLCLLPYFLPTDKSISSAFLWHPDLHTENIFVHPDRPSEVLSIIDWQSSEILPLFDHARQPYFLDYDGPPATGLDPPEFPKNFDELDPDEQRRAHGLYLNMSLATLYRKLTSTKNGTLFRAMEFGQTPSFDMMLFAQNLLIDGEALYRARILDIEQEWSSLPGVQASGTQPFPLEFSAEDVNSIGEDADGAIEGMELMQSVKESLGELWPEKGIVRPERYDEAKRLLKEIKTELIARLAHSEAESKAWEESWPFDD
ncbi:phosphotransferase enzyme family protein [Aspergillus ibericus CBS 121593]|uniref:Phosphotransferase enzyme family protein n=1 Tax=Aspergillus ibericus CBS 121593 TaxID=1448316 RepID=A0A395GKN8_9EURO|nr:phosphotransferase enzyme family protein [Aspergillus ibericus CBS 121593]RAK96065.1 phosphotransferase enzyme family protein [Aspergillus ibericus CBS 121593]